MKSFWFNCLQISALKSLQLVLIPVLSLLTEPFDETTSISLPLNILPNRQTFPLCSDYFYDLCECVGFGERKEGTENWGGGGLQTFDEPRGSFRTKQVCRFILTEDHVSVAALMRSLGLIFGAQV